MKHVDLRAELFAESTQDCGRERAQFCRLMVFALLTSSLLELLTPPPNSFDASWTLLVCSIGSTFGT